MNVSDIPKKFALLRTGLLKRFFDPKHDVSVDEFNAIVDALKSGGAGINPFVLLFVGRVTTHATDTSASALLTGATGDTANLDPSVITYPVVQPFSAAALVVKCIANTATTDTACTLIKNGATTGLTLTITAGTTGDHSFDDVAVSLAPGDSFALALINTAGGTSHEVDVLAMLGCNPLSPIAPDAADATTSVHGLMSAADKTKLDGFPASSVPTSRTITASTGLAGGGDLSANRSLAVDTAVIATRAYVDAIAQGLSIKQSVRVATTANGTLATAFANGQTVDGVVLATGDRILLKDQTTSADRGIYTVNASGAPTRATDWDASADLAAGAFMFVEEGTANADSGWVLTTDGAIVVGTTAIAFTQFSGAGQITAGSGLSKSGNTLSLSLTAALVITAMASAASALAMNAQKITGVADPTSAQDAATKKYVDTTVFTAVKTAAYTILAADRWILVDDTAGRVDLTMPALDGVTRIIQKVGGGTGGIRLIRTGSEKINTVAASYDLPGSTAAFASATPQAWTTSDNGTDRFVV